jgi:ParE-like toxin of type II ParDE toxin-antitoxin system
LEVYEAGELDEVPRAKLKTALRQLRRNPEAGKPLERALKGCRSIRPDGVTNRIVYRVFADGVVEVIAIERRRDNKVYDTAARRL